MHIEPNTNILSHKQGTIRIPYDTIVQTLGEPNVADDFPKVQYSWGYDVDGEPIAIWDWKGSGAYHEWSFFGSHGILRKLFGDRVVIYSW